MAATARVPKDLRPNLQRTTAIVSFLNLHNHHKWRRKGVSQNEIASDEISKMVRSRASGYLDLSARSPTSTSENVGQLVGFRWKVYRMIYVFKLIANVDYVPAWFHNPRSLRGGIRRTIK